jgi:uncharacterized repeat protein (TIGR03843 family)
MGAEQSAAGGSSGSGVDDLDAVLLALTEGELDVQGRLVDASNATLVATCTHDGRERRVVYKPVAGERPLWDFPDGTLGHREVAAYLVSSALGWDVVPPTAWREDGPFGEGMCQLWVDTPASVAAFGTGATRFDVDDELLHPDDEGDDTALVDLVAPGREPAGWRTVLDAHGSDGRPVILTHADVPELARMALFDAVVNNADRKGGHVLVATDGAVRGVDHGICFHLDDKLRTVLWGWAGEPVPAPLLADLVALRDRLDGSLGAVLVTHLAPEEVAATAGRLDQLIRTETFPLPTEGWPSIPWPAF